MLFLLLVQVSVLQAQSPKLQSIVMVTDDQDSLVRAFTRQGFTVQPLERNPVYLFRDHIVLPNKTSVILESPRIHRDWRDEALLTLGRPFVSALRFYAENPDSLRRAIEASGIGVVLLDSMSPSLGFSIDSTAPLVLTFASDTLSVMAPEHPRGYYRIDWIILGVSQDTEERLRRLFDAIGMRKSHRGCCDFWRAGSPQDFTFLRFETPQPPWRGEPQWLSIGKNALYFAYR